MFCEENLPLFLKHHQHFWEYVGRSNRPSCFDLFCEKCYCGYPNGLQFLFLYPHSKNCCWKYYLFYKLLVAPNLDFLFCVSCKYLRVEFPTTFRKKVNKTASPAFHFVCLHMEKYCVLEKYVFHRRHTIPVYEIAHTAENFSFNFGLFSGFGLPNKARVSNLSSKASAICSASTIFLSIGAQTFFLDVRKHNEKVTFKIFYWASKLKFRTEGFQCVLKLL